MLQGILEKEAETEKSTYYLLREGFVTAVILIALFRAHLLTFIKAIFVPSMWPWNKSEEMLLEYKNFMKIYATFSMCKVEGAIKEL